MASIAKPSSSLFMSGMALSAVHPFADSLSLSLSLSWLSLIIGQKGGLKVAGSKGLAQGNFQWCRPRVPSRELSLSLSLSVSVSLSLANLAIVTTVTAIARYVFCSPCRRLDTSFACVPERSSNNEPGTIGNEICVTRLWRCFIQ